MRAFIITVSALIPLGVVVLLSTFTPAVEADAKPTTVVRVNADNADNIASRLRIAGTEANVRVLLEEPGSDAEVAKAPARVESVFTSLGPPRKKTVDLCDKQYVNAIERYARERSVTTMTPAMEATLFERTELKMAQLEMLRDPNRGSIFLSEKPPGLKLPGYRTVTRHPVVEILNEHGDVIRDYSQWPPSALRAKMDEGEWRRANLYMVFLIPLDTYPNLRDAADVVKGIKAQTKQNQMAAFNMMPIVERAAAWEAAKKARTALSARTRENAPAMMKKHAATAMLWVRRYDELANRVTHTR